jgi:hypothetical protein
MARQNGQRVDFRAVRREGRDAISGDAAGDSGDEEEPGRGRGVAKKQLSREGVAAERGSLNAQNSGEVVCAEGANGRV